jgi:hypothetical protein
MMGGPYPNGDAEVARLRAELSSTLASMGDSLERLASRDILPGVSSQPATPVTFRIDGALETRLARFMRMTGMHNQAKAIRLLLSMALASAGVRE